MPATLPTGSAKRINDALGLAGMSKRQLARDLAPKLGLPFDTTHAYVKRWTNRSTTPRAPHLQAIAEVLAKATGQRVEVFKTALEPDPDEEESRLRRDLEDWQRMGADLMARLATQAPTANAGAAA